MTESQQLLAEYVENSSEAAFRELVARYVNLVYSTALRIVEGDTLLAEDVTQTVFIRLSQNARKLTRESRLGGWLHRDTCFVASNAIRSERRRQLREQQAAPMDSLHDHSEANLAQVAPILDEAINLLGANDRAAILLRFFEQRDFRAVGAALGSNEDAARMRVNRALEKLQLLLKRRGVTFSAAALGTALTSQAITIAPASLAATAATAAIASGIGAISVHSTLLTLMAATKLKAGIVALVIAGLAIPLAIQYQANARLRADLGALQQKYNDLAGENDRLAKSVTKPKAANLPEEQFSELLKLRGEVGVLKTQLAEKRNAVPNNGSATASSAAQLSPEDQQRDQAILLMRDAGTLVAGLVLYAEKNGGQYPPDFAQLAENLDGVLKENREVGEPARSSGEFLQTAANRFELVYHGKSTDISNPASTIVLRETQAWPSLKGGWNRTYGFADGHTEVHKANDGIFDSWESKHAAPAGRHVAQ